MPSLQTKDLMLTVTIYRYALHTQFQKPTFTWWHIPTWSQLSMAAISRPTLRVWFTASGYSCWAIDNQSTTITLASISRRMTAETSLCIQLSNIPLICVRERRWRESNIFRQTALIWLTVCALPSHIDVLNSNNQSKHFHLLKDVQTDPYG